MRRKVLIILLTAAVLAIGFGVRMASVSLSAIPEAKRDFFRDDGGDPYLTEIDSYYYVRMACRMAEENRIILFNDRETDPLTGPRIGGTAEEKDPLLLSVIAFCLWKVLSLFSSVSVIQVCRWIGPMISPLAGIPVFFYVRRRTNTAGAVTGALLAATAIPFAGHTYAGFFDTDCLLAVLPLCIILAQLRAMQESDFRKQILYSALSALSFAALSLSWSGYYAWFWLAAIGGAIGGILSLLHARGGSPGGRTKALRGAGVSILLSLLMLAAIRGADGIEDLCGAGAQYHSVFDVSAFPFALRHTEEMQPLVAFPDLRTEGIFSLLKGGANSLLNRGGGLLPWLAALLWLIPGIFRLKAGKAGGKASDKGAKCVPGRMYAPETIEPWLQEAGLVGLWLAAGIWLALKYRRAAEIAVLPLTVLAGLGVGFVSELLKGQGSAIRQRALAAALTLAVGTGTVTGALAISRANVPGIAEAVAQAMAYTRVNEPDNAVIASWWDDGYYMQYEGRRRTLADGGFNSGTRAFFLARALLTGNPAEAAGIFRMLETSGTGASLFLAGHGIADAEAAVLLLRMAPLSRKNAKEMLEAETALSPEEQTELLNMTHPEENVPLLLTLSSDMLKKLDAISYYGLWDMEQQNQHTSLYRQVSESSGTIIPGSAIRFTMSGSEEELTVLITEDGDAELIRDPKTMYYNTSKLSLWENGECRWEKDLGGSGPAVILLKEGDRLCAFACNSELRDSLLVRLFVCGDRSVSGTEEAGCWYGDIREGDSRIRSLLNADDRTAWGVRVWRMEEYSD